jgi:hypothetical protein
VPRRADGGPAGGVGGAGQIEQVGPFGLVELQSPRQRVEDTLGYALEVAAFQARVVVDADAGHQGDFLAAQTAHPTARVR